MKKFLFLLIFFISCKEEDVSTKPLANLLVGSTWLAEMGSTDNGYIFVRMIKFNSESECYKLDYYYDGKLIRINGVPEYYTFKRNLRKLSLTDRQGRSYKAEIDGNSLKMDYTYMLVDKSWKAYLTGI